MDLDQLHTFLEIVRLKSFSKAAQTCYRTQPAISAQVRQLEQELNASLFERLGTKIALTAAGKILVEYAEQILDLRRRAQDAINELDRMPRGELVIAANEATCIYVLPQVFSEFKKKFPNVQLSVDRSYGSRVVEAVMNNLADFGITQLPVQEKKLQVAEIHTDEIMLLVPGKHALAGKKIVTSRDLSGHQLLLPKSGTTRTRLDVWLEPVEDELRISMELDSTEMIKRFVMAGLGLSFLAASHCREEVASGKLCGVSLGPEPMFRKLALIYRKDKALSKAALGFIQVILEHARADGRELCQAPRGRSNLTRGSEMSRVTLKSSTIFISVGNKTKVFRSVNDVPAPLRKKLEQSTNSINSATILIADRKGKEEIVRAIHGLPSSLRSRLAASLRQDSSQGPNRWAALWQDWAEILLPAAIGLAVWLLFTSK